MAESRPQSRSWRELLQDARGHLSHYHGCPADDDSGACDCYGGILMRDIDAALNAPASENRTQEALRACLTSMTNELRDGQWIGRGPGSKYRDAMRAAEEALK